MADAVAVRRRRGAPLVASVLDATLESLAEEGYGFSIDDVAERAGVHKTTIYRRWGSKPQLVAAAMDRFADSQVVAPRTDDPIEDLTDLAVSVARSLRSPGALAALSAIVSASSEDPSVRVTARAFLALRYRVATELVERAVARGLIDPHVDPVLIWEAIANPLHVHALVGDPADDATARRLVELIVNGCAMHAAPRGP